MFLPSAYLAGIPLRAAEQRHLRYFVTVGEMENAAAEGFWQRASQAASGAR